MDVLACPTCRGQLASGEDRWTCRECQQAYRALRGIPDLRTADDIYLSNAHDWSLALRLSDDYDRLDFRGLLERYYDLCPEITTDRRARQVAHILTAPGRAAQWIAGLELDLGQQAGCPAPLLDLGCGPGGFLAAATIVPGLGGRPLWGLDIAMRWLILARKRLEESGLSGVGLVCGCAERLPCLDGVFDGIVAGDAIEHVTDSSLTLSEAHRVLRPGARIVLATPNRFSLGREPHVGLWGVGFLPRPWMRPYAEGIRRRDFRAIHTRSAGGWRRLLRRSPFRGGQVIAPPLPEEELAQFPGLKRAIGKVYNRAIETPPGRAFALAFGPLLHLVAQREPETSRSITNRATRQRSMPSATRR